MRSDARAKVLDNNEIKTEMIRILPQLRRFALGLCGSPDQADDLVQATCERAIRSLDTFEQGSRLDSWMYRILQNLHLNSIRDKATRERHLKNAAIGAEISMDGSTAAAAALELKTVLSFVNHLQAEYREVLLLVAIEGRGYRETADYLNIPIGTVTSRLARARLKLRLWVEGQETAKNRTEADASRGVL